MSLHVLSVKIRIDPYLFLFDYFPLLPDHLLRVFNISSSLGIFRRLPFQIILVAYTKIKQIDHIFDEASLGDGEVVVSCVCPAFVKIWKCYEDSKDNHK